MGLDPNTIRPRDLYAYKDADGNWRAGPRSRFQRGQFVPESYAKKVTKAAKRRTLIKRAMRNRDLSEDEARAEITEYIEEQDEIGERDDLTPEQRRDLIRDLQRSKLGS